jgi:2'-5' RNA ligase
VLLALDVALLLPPDVHRRAVALSASLPDAGSQGLRLDDGHPPHITLTQQFIRIADQPAVLGAVAGVLRHRPPPALRITGGGRGTGAVWLSIERTPALFDLHTALMSALEPFEQSGGGADAFVDDARADDVRWVAGFRTGSSFDAFAPHVTLGHAAAPPRIEPIGFEAPTVVACHLGRFCTCRRVLARWRLGGA